MSGRRVKLIRLAIYGDLVSNAAGRFYGRHSGSGQVIASPPRALYQRAKREWPHRGMKRLPLRPKHPTVRERAAAERAARKAVNAASVAFVVGE